MQHFKCKKSFFRFLKCSLKIVILGTFHKELFGEVKWFFY